jgi:hypothetical protein
MDILLTEIIPAVPTGETAGHGQGLRYNGVEYYNAQNKEIPKDRAVALMIEKNASSPYLRPYQRDTVDNGRRWIIVRYDPERNGFILLEEVTSDLMHKLVKYKDKK